jgi:hypothetical protein
MIDIEKEPVGLESFSLHKNSKNILSITRSPRDGGWFFLIPGVKGAFSILPVHCEIALKE